MDDKEKEKKLVGTFIEVVYDCGYEKAKQDMLNELKYIRAYTAAEQFILARFKNTIKMLKRSDKKNERT